MTPTAATLKAALSQAFSAAQDHALTLTGDEVFYFAAWLRDLDGMRREFLSGSPFCPPRRDRGCRRGG